MSFSVRPAADADVAAIVRLEAQAFPLDPWSANLIGDGVAGRTPTVALFVAEQADPDRVPEFVGYAVVSVVDVDAELQRIAVAEEVRRSGIAGLLLTAVRRHSAEHGAQRLLLEVREDNLSARRFYDRHGFGELGRRARYYRDQTTAVVLSAPVTMEP